MLRRALLRVCAVAFVCGFAQSVAAQDCAEERILKSGTGTAASELLFRNQGAERRKVYWLDGNGQRTFYSAVEPNNVYQQQTLESHIWVVTDEADKCLDIVTATATPAKSISARRRRPRSSRRRRPVRNSRSRNSRPQLHHHHRRRRPDLAVTRASYSRTTSKPVRPSRRSCNSSCRDSIG